MILFAETCLNLLRGTHDAAKNIIAGLPSEALDWVPGPDMNSLNTLVTHTAGAERLLIGTMIGGLPNNRDREKEFAPETTTVEALNTLLDDSLTVVQGVLENMALEDLEKLTRSPMSGREFPVAWALMHALEHTANHVGHMEITRQMWNLK